MDVLYIPQLDEAGSGGEGEGGGSEGGGTDGGSVSEDGTDISSDAEDPIKTITYGGLGVHNAYPHKHVYYW